MWCDCEHRWSLDYLEARRAPVFSKYMDFGTSLHDALEKYKNPNKEEKISLEEACDTFERTFREAMPETAAYEKANYDKLPEEDQKPHKAPLTPKEINEWIIVGKHVLRKLHTLKELDDARVLFVEHAIMMPIDRTDGIETNFKGFIDIVIKTKDKRGKSVVYICDYKTCSWGWSIEKKRDEKLQMQLRLYKHFFCKEFNIDPKQVRCAFILLKRVHSKKNPDNVADWLAISAGPKTVKRAVDNLSKAITGMNSGVYKKNLKMCVNDYGDVCPYKDTPLCLKD